MGKKDRLRLEPHHRRMRGIAWFCFWFAAVAILVGIAGDIWGGFTYDNMRGWDKNPGKYQWMVGMIGSGAGVVFTMLAAMFATWDRAKLAKNQKLMLAIQGFLVVGIFAVVYATFVYFQRS